MTISLKDLTAQYNRIKRAGWLPSIQAAARLSGSTTAHWLAFGSRETNLRNIRGDYRNGKYNGFGVVQVDVGTDPIFAKNWRADSVDSVARGFKRGAEIFNDKQRQILSNQGRRVVFKKRSFIGKKVDAEDLRRISTAAYNCGLWAYYHFSNGNHVDSTTTGKDYSRDVYDRAVEFAALLAADGTEPNALKEEVRLQGKYARNEHRKRAGLKVLTQAEAARLVPELKPAPAMDSEENLARAGYHSEEEIAELTGNKPAFVPDPQAAPTEEIIFTEGERPPATTGSEDHSTVQNADAIINQGETGDNAKIEAAKNAPPVAIPEPAPTGFFDQIKKLAYGVITGTVALPFLDKVFGVQLTPEQIELLKVVFPYAFFGIVGGLSVYYIGKKVNNYFVSKLIADKNADVTQRNIVIVPRIAPRPSANAGLLARLRYALTGELPYYENVNLETRSVSGAIGRADSTARKTLNL